MKDERLGLPSISGLERLEKCRGSWNLTQYAAALYPPKDKKTNALAQSGRNVHAALAGEDVELSHYEQWTADQCARYEELVLAQLKEQYDFEPQYVFREQRFHLKNSSDEIISTGQPDVLYKCWTTKSVLIVDYKSGTGASTADTNWQLMGYAVLAYQQPFFSKEEWGDTFLAIIQPNAPESVTIAKLTADELRDAEVQIIQLLEDAKTSHVRHAGDHCKFCPAKAFCPEYLTSGDEIVESLSLPVVNADIPRMIETAPIERVIELYELRNALQSLSEAVASRLKRQLSNNPGSVPGYELRPSGSIRTIDDIKGAKKKMKANGCTAARFDALLKLSVSDLEKLHKEVTELKGKDAELDFERIFSDIIIYTPKEPVIKKIK